MEPIERRSVRTESNGLVKYTTSPTSNFIKEIVYSYGVYQDKRVTERVTVSFTDGKVIEYQADETLYKQFITAESAGKFWHKNIKNVITNYKILHK